MVVTVYSLPASICVRCRAVEISTRRKGIEVVKVELDKNPDAMTYIKSLGYAEAPVIVVTEGDEVVDHWSGYSEERITSLKEMVAA
jgi:glutaredoxin-like protein NrdH